MSTSVFVYSTIAFVFLAIAVHALWAFTRRIGGAIDSDRGGQDGATAKRVRMIVWYGYFSIFVLMAAAILPFMLPGFPDNFPGPNAPIQILKACPVVVDKEAKDDGQLHCRADRTHWAVNIGGVVKAKTVTVPDAHREDASRRLQAVFSQTGIQTRDAIQNVGELPEAVKSSIAETAENTIQSIASMPGPSVVSGGLVVPLYMIVIALIGGCIGMTRRLPELQTRGAPGYKAYYKRNKAVDPTLKRPLEGVHVREYVVFQVMQAVFAPFLAMVAFALIDPADIAGVVAIGFIAGFASESILLQIKKVADAASKPSSGKLAPTA
jgi:hypothetical protein